MIERQFGLYVIECDHCGDPWDTERGDFEEAIGRAKAEGWRFRKVAVPGLTLAVQPKMRWEHYCPTCPEKAAITR